MKDIQHFLSFANFYRKFIPNFAHKVKPLTQVLKKKAKFAWMEREQSAFQELKQLFAAQPLIYHQDALKNLWPINDLRSSSKSGHDFRSGILTKEGGWLHPSAFYSKALTAPKRNYDKELLHVKVAFEQLWYWLEGSSFPMEVCKYHKNLQMLQKTQLLSPRHVR